MYNTALLLLVGASMGQAGGNPTWLNDYTAAGIQGARAGRPLAVFVGKGRAGADQCCREGKLGGAAVRLLAEHYVCVYVNSDDPSRKWLVDALKLTTGKGVVLSDRRGTRQTFHHDGPLAVTDLVRALEKGAGVFVKAESGLAIFTSADFETQVLQSKQPVLVDFYADWCGPCRGMLPVVTALGDEMRGVARVGKLNTDRNPALVSRYGVSAIPAFLIFREGRVVDRVVGSTTKEDLAARLRAASK